MENLTITLERLEPAYQQFISARNEIHDALSRCTPYKMRFAGKRFAGALAGGASNA